MSCSKFKLSAVAAVMLVAANAHAAIYKVKLANPDTVVLDNYEVYGTAINHPSTTVGEKGCFGTECDANAYTLAGNTIARYGNTYENNQGIGYREEVPFGLDNYKLSDYVKDSKDFRSFCYAYLDSSTSNKLCDTWGDEHFNRYKDSKNFNAQTFLGSDFIDDSNLHAVINSISSDDKVVGNKYDGNSTFYNVAFKDDLSLDIGNYQQSRAWKSDDTYTIGSVSDGNSAITVSHATIWKDSDIVGILNGSSSSDDYLAQASFRDFYKANDDKLELVGYRSSGKYALMKAIVATYTPSADDASNPADSSIAVTEIGGITYDTYNGDDGYYQKGVAVAINKNELIIGYATNNRAPGNGAIPNRLFTASTANPTATFHTSGIFGDNKSVTPEAVNNFNEIVGHVDEDTFREIQRDQRGFIYPYQATETERSKIFKNKAWWLDDLTNDGNVSGDNNGYRIIDASDINDDGVIAATAKMCTSDGATAMPYDNTAYNATCGGDVKIVAVKLIPMNDASSSDIQPREFYYPPVERQGAGLGWLALTMLGLFSFRRKQ